MKSKGQRGSEDDALDTDRINPLEPMRKIAEMLEADFKRYTDPKSSLLRREISEPVTACPACAASDEQFESLFQKGPFQYQQCQSCELVFVNPRLNEAETTALYREGRCMYQTKNFYLPHAEYRANRIYRPKLKDLKERYGVGKLLDFGSSTGYFMKTAKEMGWKVAGVELNPFGVKWAREELGLENVHDRPLQDCGFDEQEFDIVTMWDVLEHLADPADALIAIRPLLKSGGNLVIETSHYDCLETDLLGAENTNIVGDMHLLHFTRKSLRTLLERCGFAVDEFSIFGLDIKHLLNYQALRGAMDYRLPETAVAPLQRCVDEAERGCYIKAYAARR